MASVTSAAGGPRTVVVFEVSGQALAMPCESVEEVLPMVALSRPPDAPAWLEGLFELEGTLVPWLCAARALRIGPRPATLDSHLLLVRSQRGHRALRVDRVHEVLALDHDELRPYEERWAGEVTARCSEGQFDWRSRPCVLLRCKALLGQDRVEQASRPGADA